MRDSINLRLFNLVILKQFMTVKPRFYQKNSESRIRFRKLGKIQKIDVKSKILNKETPKIQKTWLTELEK